MAEKSYIGNSVERTKSYTETMRKGRSLGNSVEARVFRNLSKKDQDAAIEQRYHQTAHKMKTDPKYNKKAKAEIKAWKNKQRLKKLKRKGHMTHGSKYRKLESCLSIKKNVSNR